MIFVKIYSRYLKTTKWRFDKKRNVQIQLNINLCEEAPSTASSANKMASAINKA